MDVEESKRIAVIHAARQRIDRRLFLFLCFIFMYYCFVYVNVVLVCFCFVVGQGHSINKNVDESTPVIKPANGNFKCFQMF
jgi:hypothetical protein